MRDRLDAVEAQQAVDVLRAACGEGVVQFLARRQMVVPTVDPWSTRSTPEPRSPTGVSARLSDT
jgi:hypothetical protein